MSQHKPDYSSNYSKWKDIEVSDDEDDTHPNVDTPSLYRWRHQARLERMAEHKKDKEEIELQKNDFTLKLNSLDKKLAATDLADGAREKLTAEQTEMKAQHDKWLAKEAELTKAEEMEKWNVDTISHETWSTTRINKTKDQPAPKRTEEEDSKLMREYFDKHEKEIKHLSLLSSWKDSEQYLLDHPFLCSEWAANYMTLEALNAGITQKENRLRKMAGQVIMLQYLLELAKSLKANPENPTLIQGFFRKISAAEEQYMKMYHDEVAQFLLRVHKRAAVKREEAMQEAEEEERQDRIKLSPGGLDPIKVLEESPKAMREAFESQDIARMQAVASEMESGEFERVLDLWIKSGLWVPGPNDLPPKADAADEQTEEKFEKVDD